MAAIRQATEPPRELAKVMTCTVYLVGAGPGPVDLLTLRAARIIAQANVLIYDALVTQEVLNLAPKATLINVGKRAGLASAAQQDINKVLVSQALIARSENKTIVRLKGGDALIFARAEEEISALREAGIEFEVVSGITAAQAAFAAIKVPLTKRGIQRSAVLATAQVQKGGDIGTAWARPIVAAGGGAIYMAASAASRIKGTLLALGMPAHTPVTWVGNAGFESSMQCCQTLQNLQNPEFINNPPVILLIGAEPEHIKKRKISQWTQPTSSTLLGLSAPALSLA